METNQNQAMTLYPLFFDPIYRNVGIEKIDGKNVFKYHDEPRGVLLEDNGDITFTMFAPSAKKIEVSGFGGTIGADRRLLTKQRNGYHIGTFSGIGNGFHYHRFWVDGVEVTNPLASITYGCFGATNFIEKPAPNQDFWFIKDVPHGDVQIRRYISTVNGHIKQCYIYLPPSYNKNNEKKYPVMYLQHGVGESETGWIWNGKANFIMDNLIAEDKSEEMILVMCSGYAFKPGEDPVFYPGDFAFELIKDVIPFIDSNFRTIRNRENRAMAGLSLGSAQAIQIVSRYPEYFAHLGVFSGVKYEETETILSNFDTYPIRTVYMTGGIDEHLDVVQIPFVERFAEKGANAGQSNYEGHHEWHVWRESLRDFAKLSFKNPETKTAAEENLRPYTPLEIDIEQYDKQTFDISTLMFDPIYKDVIFDFDENGNPAGRYRDKHHGYEIKDPVTGIVRFWFYAPDAKKVEVNLWGITTSELEKMEDGWWTGTVDKLEQGFHYYSYFVNGVETIDKNGAVGYGGFKATNILEIPEDNFTVHRMRPVPHGSIHLNYYTSNRTHREKMCYVYTPPSYEKDADRRYPVLYIQHGGGENEMGWLGHGHLNDIADNLIHDGKMEEMIIVMSTNYGFPTEYSYDSGLTDGVDEIPLGLVPFIDSTYRTIANRENRAMSGLSMGAMMSQRIVFKYPELFANVGILSGGLDIVREDFGLDYSDILLNPENFKKQFDVFFVSCGNEEWSYGLTKDSEEKILEAGVDIHTYHAHGYHDWTFWRHSANEFLPLLFKS